MISSPCPKCLNLLLHNANECSESRGIYSQYKVEELRKYYGTPAPATESQASNAGGEPACTCNKLNFTHTPSAHLIPLLHNTPNHTFNSAEEPKLLHYQQKHLSPYYVFELEKAAHPYPFDIKLIIYDTLNEPEKSKAEFKDYLNVLSKKYGYETGMDEKALSQIGGDGAFHSVFHPDDYSNRLSLIALPNEASELMMRAHLIHECLHSAIRIFHDVDVPINGDYSEAFCYFTERLISRAIEAIESLKELPV